MSMTGASGGEMTVGLSLEDSMSAGLRMASDNVVAFTGSVERSLAALGRLGPAAAGLGVLGLALKQGVSAAGDLQQQIANLNAVLAATPAQLQAIQASALQLSRNSQFNVAPIVSAQVQLAKAGNSPQQVVDQSKNVLDLASATFSDPTQAANTYVAAMKTFQVSTQESKATVDDITKAVDSSVGKLSDFGTAYKQIGPVAHSANISLHETNVAVADLMNAGLKGDTGTALKTFLQRIQHETPQARAEVEKLGLAFYDQAGQMLPLTNIMDQIRTKTIGLTEEQKNFSLTQIFGARGVRVADIYSDEGSAGFADVAAHMASIGDAAEIQAKKLDTLQGQAHILASSLNVLAVQGGQGVLPLFQGITAGATSAINQLTKLNEMAPLIPQLALGGGAVLGLSKFAQVRDRQKQDATAAALAKDPATLADNARYEARIKQDLAMSASYRKATEQMDAADAKFTEDFLANNVKQREAIDGLIAKEAERQAVALRTAAIDEQKALATQAVQQDFAHQRLDLTSIQSATLRGKISTGADPEAHAMLTERQALDTAEKEAIQASNASFVAQYDAITKDRVAGQIRAEQLAGTEFRDGLAAEHAKNIVAIAEGSQAEIEAAQIAYGKQIFAADALAAGGGAGAKVAISGGVVASMKSKVGGLLSSLGASLGEVAMPVIIAITAKTMILDPVLKSIAAKRAQGTTGTFDPTNTFSVDPANEREQLAAYIQQQQEAQKNVSHSGISNVLDKTKYVPFLTPVSLVGKEALNLRPDQEAANYQANIAAAKRQMDQLDAARQAAPGAKLQQGTDDLSDLLGEVSRGTMTVKEAEAAWQGYGTEVGEGRVQGLIAAGNSQKTVNQFMADGTKAILDQADALKVLQTALDEKNAKQYEDMDHARALGVSDETISRAIFGVTGSGDAADKNQIKQATADIKELETAWNSVDAAVSKIEKIDFSKGMSGLTKVADELTKAQSALAKGGVGNSSVDYLVGIANQFKAISDEEDKASAAYDGYMLNITHANDAIGKLDQIKKGFTAALDAAEQRKDRGLANQSDLDLIASAPGMYNQLADSTDKASQSSSQYWLGITKNLPDVQKGIDDFNAAVDKTGGKDLILKVDAETDLARDAIKAITDPPSPYKATIQVSYAYPDGSAAGPPASQERVPSRYDDTRGNNAGGNGLPPPPAAPPLANPNIGTEGFNKYKPLSWSDYQTIVPKNSPLYDQTTYSQLIDESKLHNVDPRFVLSFLAQEGNFSTAGGKGAWQVAAKNPGGLKWANQAGAHMGPASSEGSSPDQSYASFGTYGDYFEAMLNSITGYDAYKQGNAATTVGTWTKGTQGYADLSYDDQVRVANSKLDFYRQYSGMNTGAPLDATLYGGPNGNGYQTPTGSGGPGHADSSQDVTSIRQQIIDKAMHSLNTDTLAGYCEQFVEETVRAITGKPAVSGAHDASAAFREAQAKGLETRTPQKGDLVYYPDAGDGHVAIYMGNGQQISTADAGGNKVHIEAVGSNARYITTPGIPDDKSPYSTTNADGTIDSSKNGGTSRSVLPILVDVHKEAAAVNAIFANMSSTGVADITKQFQSLLPILQRTNEAALNGGAGPFSETEKRDADNAVARQGLAIEAASATLYQDISNHTGDVKKDIADIVALGGPMGQIFAAQAVNMAQMALASEKLKNDQADLKTGEEAQAATVASRAAADKRTQNDRRTADLATQKTARDTERSDTRSQWKIEDDRTTEQNKWKLRKDTLAIETQAENDAFQVKQDHAADELRAIDRTGTLRQRQIADEKTALDRSYQAQVGGTRANETLLTAQSRYAQAFGGNGVGAAVQLATMKAGDLSRADAFQKASNDLADAAQKQARLAEDEKFDIQTQQILDQRKHDTTLRGYRDELTTQQKIEDAKNQVWAMEDRNTQRQRTLDSWKAQDEQTNTQLTREAIDAKIADERQKEDERYANWNTNQQKLISDDQTYIKGLQDQDAALGSILSQYQTLTPLVGQSADILLGLAKGILTMAGQTVNVSGANYSASTAGLTTSTGVPYSQFPQPKKFASGTDSAPAGKGTVGESGVEMIFAGGETVVNNANTRALIDAISRPSNVVPISAARSYGDVNINLNGASSTVLDDQAKEELKAFAIQKIQESEARQNANAERARRAGGAMRS